MRSTLGDTVSTMFGQIAARTPISNRENHVVSRLEKGGPDDAFPAVCEELPEVEELSIIVRHLVAQAERSEPVYALCGEAEVLEGVLLDIEVDGVRCLLTKVSQRSGRVQEMLSPREQEIARMIARGYPNKTIAAVLDISTWTVGTYLRRIFAKLGVNTRAAMVARLMGENASQQAWTIRPGTSPGDRFPVPLQ